MEKKKSRKEITIFDSDLKWLKQILEHSILNGTAILDNINLKYNGRGKWNHIRFSYKDIDLTNKK